MNSDDAASHVVEAILLGRTDILMALLETVRSDYAKQEDRAEMFQSFLDAPRNDEGSFIHLAVKHGKQDIVLALLQLGSDPSVLDCRGKRLLESQSKDLQRIFLPAVLSAFASSNDLLVRRLLDAGLDASAVDNDSSRRSLLHWAANYGSASAVQLLVDAGAEVNACDKHGATPLHDALAKGAEEAAVHLIKAGADVNAQMTVGPLQGKSALDVAQSSGRPWTSALLSLLPITTNGYQRKGSEDSEAQELAHDVREMLSLTSEESPAHRTLPAPVSPLAPVITDERLNLLWPQPSLVKQLVGEPFLFPNQLPLTISPGGESVHKILNVFELHRIRLRALNRHVFLNEDCPVDEFFGEESPSVVHCCLRKSSRPVKGSYVLSVSAKKIRVKSGDLEGLHHALNTLVQMFSLFKEEGLIPVVISDQPQFTVRGVLLDMNPFGRVPNFEFILQMIDTLSYLKVNQLQAFVRLSRDSEWSFSLFSKSDLLSIDRFCTERFIDFIPAIDVDGSYTVDDLPGLASKIRDVLKCFDSPEFLHVGPILTALLFSSVESSRLTKLLFSNVDVLMVCGNSLANVKTLELPTNLIALQYGFKVNSSFTSSLNEFQDCGLGFGICAGSGAWSNLSGSPSAMLSNVVSGHHALAKLQGGVSLVAHWSSDPAFCHSVFAWPGFITSAGLAWNSSTPLEYIDLALEELLNLHVVGNPIFPWGRVILDLGKAEQMVQSRDRALKISNQNEESVLLKLLLAPDDVNIEGIKVEDIAGAIQQIRRIQSQLLNSASSSSDVHLEAIRHELMLTSDLLLVAARIAKALVISGTNPVSGAVGGGSPGLPVVNCGIANLTPTFKTDMANKLLSLVEQYRALWLSRYHAPGLHGCLRTLNSLLKIFIPEGTEMIL